ARWNESMLADRELVRAVSEGRQPAILIDARAPERYRGDVEPVDPRAGHIPGARNAPAAANLDGGRFRSSGSLRAHFEQLGIRDGREVIAYRGSGVTAAHDVLALELAGLPGARLYG